MTSKRSTVSKAVVATVSILTCVGLGTGTAGAVPPGIDRAEVKRVRKALVAIEKRLDEARATVRELEAREEHLSDLVVEARRTLARTRRGESNGFLPGFQVMKSVLQLRQARTEMVRAEIEEIDARHRLTVVIRQRNQKIRDVESLVTASRRARLQQNPAKWSNFSIDGGLITYSADWEKVSMCESSGRWHINTGLFDGGLQFLPSTWIGFGGGEFARYAYQASKKEQIAMAERVLAIQGPQAWPNCFEPLPFDGDTG
jgi:Transglycosylase-like domain